MRKLNAEGGEEQAGAPQVNREEIDVQFSKPLAKLKAELAGLKSVDKKYEENSIMSFEGATKYLTMNPIDYVAAAVSMQQNLH